MTLTKKRNFIGIRKSGQKEFIDHQLLVENEKPYILVQVLRGKGYKVSVSYLYEYQHYLLAQRKAKADGILERLEEDGLIPYINETSLLKAIVAHAANKVQDATLKDGLDAAKALLTAKLHLTEPAAKAVTDLMSKWFKPSTDAESKDVTEKKEEPKEVEYKEVKPDED